jgi:hypothetical protein
MAGQELFSSQFYISPFYSCFSVKSPQNRTGIRCRCSRTFFRSAMLAER